MGQLNSIDLPEPGTRGAKVASSTAASKSRWWVWVLIVGVIAIGVWYFRSSRTASQASDSAVPGAKVRAREERARADLSCRL